MLIEVIMCQDKLKIIKVEKMKRKNIIKIKRIGSFSPIQKPLFLHD